MKVSELTGPLLDYWVAKAEGMVPGIDGYMRPCLFKGRSPVYNYSPSTEWADGGPIIEREGISIAFHEWWLDGPSKPPTGNYWRAYMCKPSWKKEIRSSDSSPLVNAMRCYVASKFGEEVTDE